MPIQVLATSTDGIQIDTNGRDGIVTEIWFKTEPLTPTLVYRLAQLQLTTDSHDQGFADDAEAGCYSWFEICILADANATEPRQKDGRTLTWRSHGNRVGVSDASRHFGVVFDRRGEMLDDLEVSTQIMACLHFLTLCAFFSPETSLQSVVASNLLVGRTTASVVRSPRRCWRKVRPGHITRTCSGI